MNRVLLEADFCLPPNTRVLTDDLRWVPIGTLKVGDELYGLTENREPRRQRKICKSTVVRTSRRMLRCARIELENGDVLISSWEHPWLACDYSRDGEYGSRGSYEWRTTSSLRPKKSRLFKSFEPWEVDTSWGAGYLAGAFDGEGCVTSSKNKDGSTKGVRMAFHQKDNEMLETVRAELTRRGFKFSEPKSSRGQWGNRAPCYTMHMCGDKEISRFLGSIRPPRLLEKGRRLMDGQNLPSYGNRKERGVRIISVTDIGNKEVIAIETSSRTFMAEGYATHNSQQEMRVMAHCSKCKRLIELFLRGGDPHGETAATIFSVPLEEAKQDKYRYPTKRLNFGTIYGITEEGLADDIAEHIADLIEEYGESDIQPWSVDDCARLIKEWYKLHPEIKDFRMEQTAHARRYGYVKDMFGRIRFVPEIYCPVQSVQEAGERQAGNMPIQSGSQGITKLGMARMFKERNTEPDLEHVRFLMQIHDSVIVECDGELEKVRHTASWMQESMTSVVQLLVPLEVDVKVGLNWGEMEKLDLKKMEEAVA